MVRLLLWIISVLIVPSASAQEFYEIKPHLAYAAWDGEPGSGEIKDELYKPFEFSEHSYYVRGLPENCFDLTEVDIYSQEIYEIYVPKGENIPSTDAINIVGGRQAICWALRQYYESQIPHKNYLSAMPLSSEIMAEYSEWINAISDHYQTDAFRHMADIPYLETYQCSRFYYCHDYIESIDDSYWNGTEIWLKAITDVNQDGIAEAIIISSTLTDGRGGYSTGAILTRRSMDSKIEVLSYFPDRININSRIDEFRKISEVSARN